uniref:NADH-ubiquinone oxidoreductase chain 2 n=1 Tax=Tingis cardui TaxID=1511256 RepID=A0A343WNP9_9HEMI|nr:NADH dehydrogenase subunit 2 [Tingis cardui]AWD31625.1 NADH dehydrogenase subunit 2 [Tingis cardui]
MYKFNKKILFLMLMIMSTIMIMSSTSWISMWVGMEINMMSTIPFISSVKSKEMSEKTMMYFMIQVLGSILLLTMVLIKNMLINMTINNMLITLSMMIKLGVPPFHMWMPEMFNKMSWMTIMVMITVQKINPLIVTMQVLEKNMLIPMIMIMSATIGSISGVNQVSLNKIMAFSSINHMSWIMMCMMMKNDSWMKYFIVYTMITATICVLFSKSMTFYINQLSNNSNTVNKIMMLVMMLNLGGMPPLPGFILKWMTMEYMVTSNMYSVMIMMLMSSMITLLFYMRLTYKNMMLSSMNIKFFIKKINNYSYTLFMMNMFMPLIMLI